MIKHRQKYIEHFSRKLHVEPELLEKAFKDEFEQDQPLDKPLEVPDIIEMRYKYSYGRQSRFFRELRDNAKLLGSKCPSCGITYLPPRASCGECYVDTEWVEIGTTGEIKTFTTVYYGATAFHGKTPFVCAFIKVDGADTLLMQNVLMEDASKAHVGMRVKAVFKEERNGDMGDFYFIPESE